MARRFWRCNLSRPSPARFFSAGEGRVRGQGWRRSGARSVVSGTLTPTLSHAEKMRGRGRNSPSRQWIAIQLRDSASLVSHRCERVADSFQRLVDVRCRHVEMRDGAKLACADRIDPEVAGVDRLQELGGGVDAE